MRTRMLGFMIVAVIAATNDQTATTLAAAAPTEGAPAAKPAPPPSSPPKLSTEELEKLVLPIALHPDPLIAIILPASVYPLEIVQAARFVKDTNNIPKVDGQPWDDSVKDLARFPDMIAKMDADLSWTMKLGQAFLDQRKELMDTIQALRAKANKAGTLRSTPQQIIIVTNIVVYQTNITQVVTTTKEIIQVQPANPQVIYVPTYPPTVYYPPPAYVYNPYAPLVAFGAGMAWGAVLANNCNWGHYDVDVDIDRNVNRDVNRTSNRGTSASGTRTSTAGAKQGWQPDQSRMRTSGGAGASASTREARGWSSGTSQASTRNTGASPSTGNIGARPTTGSAGARPATDASSLSRPGSSTSGRPNASPSRSVSSSPSSRSSEGAGGSAFSGMSSGSSSRSFSNRGSMSRSGGYGGGGRRGGRR